jgi:hypothetical protein
MSNTDPASYWPLHEKDCHVRAITRSPDCDLAVARAVEIHRKRTTTPKQSKAWAKRLAKDLSKFTD